METWLIIVQSLAVIILAPVFPSLVSPVPPQASAVTSTSPLGEPLAESSPHPPVRRRRAAPATITVSVRRDPSIRPIIERRDSASPSPAPPVRRVSFSPQSSTTSVPTLPDQQLIPSQPASSSGNGNAGPSTSAMRSVCSRVLEREPGPSYNLPTPPASITSVSSEADDTETAGMDEFGAVSASPGVGKRGRKTFPFSKKSKSKGKGKEVARDGEEGTSSGLFGGVRRAQSLGHVIEGGDSWSRSSTKSKQRHSIFGSAAHDEALRESEGETSAHGTDRDDRASRASTTGEKEARRRSGLSFQDFKAAFGKREHRSSVIISGSGSYSLSSSSPNPGHAPLPSDGVPRTPQSAGVGIGLGRPSTAPARVSPRSASDESARMKRRSLRLDTATPELDTERKEAQSPVIPRAQAPKYSGGAPLFGGEVVIRDEGGRRRTRSSAIPGLYGDAQVVGRW